MLQDAIVRSFYEAVNSHDFEKFTSFFADDGQFKDIATNRVYRGKNELRAMAESWVKALPDMKLQVSDVIGEGDVWCAELTMVGTHKGSFESPMGTISPSGKRISVPSCDVIRFRNGKIQSLNCYFAATILMSQIGAMPMRQAA